MNTYDPKLSQRVRQQAWPVGAERMVVAALKPYARNARTHSRKQITKIAASIERFGFVNPVLIDEDHQIIAGHGRVAAAKRLGLTEVPVLRIEHLSEEEKRAYILADNRLAEDAGWDQELLAIELQGLIDCDFAIEVTGFEACEVDIVLDDAAAANAPDHSLDDEIPPLAQRSITKLGDLWQLGGHRLLCGDALSAASYDLLLNGDQASLIFTDPPYNVPIDGHVSGLGKRQHREFGMGSGEMTPEQFQTFLQTVFGHLVAHSVSGSIHFVCMDWRHLGETLAAGESVYSELKNLCVWVKSNGGMGTFYRSRHELVFAFKNGSAEHINNFELGQNGRCRTNVWEYAGANSFGRARDDALAMHPTVKPVALVADALRDCSKRGQIVLDPFAGSGSTLVAAEKTGRRARVLELDPLYCDTIIRRWQTVTGKRAIHRASRQTFEEREELRSSDRAIKDREATNESNHNSMRKDR
jgi:DNA modification methylase